MATVLDVIKGLNQAAANAYDGALDENGDALQIGLNRVLMRSILATSSKTKSTQSLRTSLSS